MSYIKEAVFVNYKTTIFGSLAAALAALEISVRGGCGLAEIYCWGRPVMWAVFAFVARDAKLSK